MGPTIGMYSKIEWDKSVLKILTFWLRSRVHLVEAFFFFFFFCRRFGPGPVSRSVRVNPGRFGQMGQTVVGGDVIHDVIGRVQGAWILG